MTAYVSYTRVSTDKQGRSGLGLSAQQEAIARHIGNNQLLAEYQEVESGRRSDRAELRKAIDHCRRSGAILLVAKVCRLTRSTRFLFEILDSDITVEFADMPALSGPQGRFNIGILAQAAELEAGLISQRTKEALQRAKANGIKLGNPNGTRLLNEYVRQNGNRVALEGKAKAANRRAEPWRELLAELLDQGLSYRAVARTLNARGETTARGKPWSAQQAIRMVQRLGLAPATKKRPQRC